MDKDVSGSVPAYPSFFVFSHNRVLTTNKREGQATHDIICYGGNCLSILTNPFDFSAHTYLLSSVSWLW